MHLSLLFKALAVLDNVGMLERAQNSALLACRLSLLLVAARDVHLLDDVVLPYTLQSDWEVDSERCVHGATRLPDLLHLAKNACPNAPLLRNFLLV